MFRTQNPNPRSRRQYYSSACDAQSRQISVILSLFFIYMHSQYGWKAGGSPTGEHITLIEQTDSCFAKIAIFSALQQRRGCQLGD